MIKFIKLRIRPTCRFLIVLVLLCLFLNSDSVAQSITDGGTPSGIAPGSPSGSYPLGNFDNINLYNGHLDVRLPLLKIGGRGQVQMNMSVGLNLEPWIVKGTQPGAPDHDWWTVLKPGYGPGVLQGRPTGIRFSGSGQQCPQAGYTFQYAHSLTTLTFTASDGTEYELRDAQTGGAVNNYASYCPTPYSRGNIFVTADGAAATFISDSIIYDNTNRYNAANPSVNPRIIYPSGYLILRDGTRYRINQGVTEWIRDRNGNTLTFTYEAYTVIHNNISQQSKRVKTLTDSLGRVVTVNYFATYDEIKFKGFASYANGDRTITIQRSNLQQALRADMRTNKSLRELFPLLLGNNTQAYNPSVVSSVTLPDGRSYQFKYNEYAEVARVVMPTGGAVEYDFSPDFPTQWGQGGGEVGDPRALEDGYQIQRRVKERRVYRLHTDITPESISTYQATINSESGPTVVTVNNSDGSGTLLAKTKHYYYGSPVLSLFKDPIIYPPAWNEGREYQTDTYSVVAGVLGSVLVQVNNEWEKGVPVVQGAPDANTRLKSVVTKLVETNEVSKQTYTYDAYNNIIKVEEYDFGTGTPGALIRWAETTYITFYNGDNYATNTDIHLRSLPEKVSVFENDGTTNGKERSRVTYEYDNYTPDAGQKHAALVSRSNVIGWNTPFEPDKRGNITSVTGALLLNGAVTGSITTHQQYDTVGNAVKAIDGKGYATLFDFSDCYGAPDDDARLNCTVPADLGTFNTYAFPTKMSNSLGHTAYTQYDYNLGKAVNTEDANGVVSSVSFNDLLDRPTKMVRAVNQGASFKSQTSVIYEDQNRLVTTTTDLNGFGDDKLRSAVLYDGLGRIIETRQYENATAYSAIQQEYDGLGRVKKVSNPFRAGDTVYWTTTEYDSLGRVKNVTTADGSVLATDYDGSKTLVTDQADKKRLSKSDGLGRLTDVWEITPTDTNTVSVSFKGQSLTGYRAQYEYDTLGNLSKVIQGAQTRSFSYDSLSRLILARNPEQNATLTDTRAAGTWSVSYQYDDNSNILKKTEARAITTVFTYDEINRVTSKTYQSDTTGTPSVAYHYDNQTLPSGAPSFDRGTSKGRLVAVTYGGTQAGNYQAYDVLGRVTKSIQVTDARAAGNSQPNWQSYTFSSYSYDLAGNLTSQIYPSGREVGTTVDEAGRISQVWGKAPSTCAAGWDCTQGTRVYADSFSYSAHGAIKAVMLGNGLWERTKFNSRLQLEEIKLGTSGVDTQTASADRLKLNYLYGTTNNNGNVQSHVLTVPAIGTAAGFTATQSYTYDHLNRLESAQEMEAGATLWRQKFTYDRYGNRNFDTSVTTIPQPLTNLTFKQENNQFDPSASGQSSIRYDAAGNLDRDVSGQTYAFDAENRQISFNNGQASYVYDGDGRRVKKIAGTIATVFVYNAMGQMVAEYSDSGQSGGSGTSYITADQLGTPRLLTGANISDSKGGVKERHDYLPFGEEIYADTQRRTAANGYDKDNLRQKFTQYERDGETDLDYAQARYYSSAQGRFTSADPLFFQFMMAVDPQRFNLYAYARNNPLKFIDPTGERLHLRGNIGWLTNMLYEMSGGQDNFDKYFEIRNNEVMLRSGVDTSDANAGVMDIIDTVKDDQNYVYFAGTDADAEQVVDLFKGTRNKNGDANLKGYTIKSAFMGESSMMGEGNLMNGVIVGTTGREDTQQPVNLANGDPVFAVIAYNTEIERVQRGVDDSPQGLVYADRATQASGVGQVIRPVSVFIHETAENRAFANMTPRQRSSHKGYIAGHGYAQVRERIIRKELGITGGFAGGAPIRMVPR